MKLSPSSLLSTSGVALIIGDFTLILRSQSVPRYSRDPLPQEETPLSNTSRCQTNPMHVASLRPLDLNIKSFHHKWGTQQGNILTHCQQELMHVVWKFLLDEDFLHAYTYRIVMQSLDGIE